MQYISYILALACSLLKQFPLNNAALLIKLKIKLKEYLLCNFVVPHYKL